MANKVCLLGFAVLLGAAPAWGEQALLDPTQPPRQFSTPEQVGQVGVKQQLHLQSILHSEGRATASIDDGFYTLGDKIGRWQVAAISRSEVVLEQGKERLVLT